MLILKESYFDKNLIILEFQGHFENIELIDLNKDFNEIDIRLCFNNTLLIGKKIIKNLYVYKIDEDKISKIYNVNFVYLFENPPKSSKILLN